MKSNTGCLWLRLVGLVIGASLLSACATVSSEQDIGACPPVVEYDAGFQAQAAKEVQALPKETAIVEMLNDYAVMRDQARACPI